MIRTRLSIDRKSVRGKLVMLLAVVAAGSMLVSPLFGQASAPAAKPSHIARSRFQPDHFAGRAGKYYALLWGIESLKVKAVEAGELIKFSYQVIDPRKAQILNDRNIDPKMIDPAAHLILVVPELEKVGKLRQNNKPEAGKTYWMAFSNPGGTVKRGTRVNVVIGQFHADGLVVE